MAKIDWLNWSSIAEIVSSVAIFITIAYLAMLKILSQWLISTLKVNPMIIAGKIWLIGKTDKMEKGK